MQANMDLLEVNEDEFWKEFLLATIKPGDSVNQKRCAPWVGFLKETFGIAQQ